MSVLIWQKSAKILLMESHNLILITEATTYCKYIKNILKKKCYLFVCASS